MTISSIAVADQYTGNGALVTYVINFSFITSAEVEVSIDGVLQAAVSDYNVVGSDVVFVTAPASGTAIVIKRISDFLQSSDYVSNDPFPAETHEGALDKLTIQTQFLKEELRKAIRIPDRDPVSLNPELPIVAERADKLMGFDPAGLPVATSTTLSQFEALAAGLVPTGVGWSDFEFTGDGTTTAFTLTGVNLVSKLTVLTWIDGLMQAHSGFSIALSGANTILTFSEAPPNAAAISVLGLSVDVAVVGTDVTVTTFMKTLLDDTTAAGGRATLDAQEDVVTTQGDIVIGDGTGAASRLAKGTSGQYPRYDGTTIAPSALLSADLPAATDVAQGALAKATKAEQETGTAVDKIVTPGRQQFHPSAVSAWADFDITGAINESHNIASVTDTSTSNKAIVIDNDMAAATYGVLALQELASDAAFNANIAKRSPATTGFTLYHNAETNITGWTIAVLGDLA
jgi:hypothetical protein